jgi:hypothetical protein
MLLICEKNSAIASHPKSNGLVISRNKWYLKSFYFLFIRVGARSHRTSEKEFERSGNGLGDCYRSTLHTGLGKVALRFSVFNLQLRPHFTTGQYCASFYSLLSLSFGSVKHCSLYCASSEMSTLTSKSVIEGRALHKALPSRIFCEIK